MISDIIDYYGGEISEEFVSLPGEEIVAPVETISEEVKPREQLTLFEQMFGGVETFDTIEDFTPERKEEILKNFADKHKMTTEQAKEYINNAIAENREEVINKLKDCY
jgi:hypothetical protein